MWQRVVAGRRVNPLWAREWRVTNLITTRRYITTKECLACVCIICIAWRVGVHGELLVLGGRWLSCIMSPTPHLRFISLAWAIACTHTHTLVVNKEQWDGCSHFEITTLRHTPAHPSSLCCYCCKLDAINKCHMSSNVCSNFHENWYTSNIIMSGLCLRKPKFIYI